MHAAFLLGAVIIVVLVVVDWIAFTRKSASVLRYGARVGRHDELIQIRPERFDAAGNLALPRGTAWICPEQRAILLLPDWKRFGLRFRTAWPLNGTLHYTITGEPAVATLVKRMLWSSALLTAIWFLTVTAGIVIYLVSYAQAGGFSSAPGAFLAVALSGLALLVLLFGLIVVVAAYRLENKRLMLIYEELRSALNGG